MKRTQQFFSLSQRALYALFLSLCISVSPVVAADATQAQSSIGSELEDIKSQVIQLNRDLFILEEDLLFPASTQIAVFVSVDVGRFFTLDSVELKINNQDVAGFLYTQRQRRALEKGGIQKLYMGNLKTGQHQLTAIFTGIDAEGRTIQRAVNHPFEKTDETIMVELKLEDSESSYRADVSVEEWVL
ncbi:AraC family transcriptional regulator [Shewanella sp. UCD-FRSSP16_17]|uniref:AraC family transcriptional regulator n=1 Tax=Shewanella sp. UCD-FRSSP16_17 TaxID=1853256 RepID=UPI0007EEDCF4|nr:AraC family transcriptional regulator [Shewanella sp. UCD-FRSSP16_17]OBT09564.1 AraC family transcriptional regulator [Shewanella sp. UCD-FRSSP16_17]